MRGHGEAAPIWVVAIATHSRRMRQQSQLLSLVPRPLSLSIAPAVASLYCETIGSGIV